MASPEQPQTPATAQPFQPQTYDTTPSLSAPKRDFVASPPPPAITETPSIPMTQEKAVKRFKPEPIETTTRSNRTQSDAMHVVSNPSQRSSMASPETSASSHTSARRKFAPESVEISTRSNKKHVEIDTNRNSIHEDVTSEDTSKTPARRKFQVELIETAQRSRKTGDPAPHDLLIANKNRPAPPPSPASPDFLNVRPGQPRTVSNPSIPMSILLKPSPNRQGSMHPHYNTRAPSRSHSWRVPDLESIASSESNRSDGSTSPASTTHSYQDATRMRESVDDRFSGYLLALAARAAEKQLREQEDALYPSSDAHEPIAHYVDSEESDGMDVDSPPSSMIKAKAVKKSYRTGSDDEQIALRELQRHGETNSRGHAERDRGRTPTSMAGQRKRTGAFNVEFDSEAKQDAWVQAPPPRNMIGGYQKDPDLKQMRKAASPPMLGGDMEFPRCPSPDHARFDVTQGSEYLRNTMCYLSNQGGEGAQKLWEGKSKGARQTLHRSAASTTSVTQAKKEEKKKSKPLGLWGGHCNETDVKMFATPIGLVTPKASPSLERDDPFSQLAQVVSAPTAGAAGAAHAVQRPAKLPPSPPASNSSLSTSRDPATEAKLAAEFPDSFVTQVYNYLSLGFPALARKFDDELAKISGVPVAELRRDDRLAEQRGYIRLGEDEVNVDVPRADTALPDADEDEDVELSETMCRRWLALRLYLREWGRQMGVADANADLTRLDPTRAWGLPARKGSWGN